MRSFRVSRRFLVVAGSVLALAASVLPVTASARSESSGDRARPFHLTKECSQYDGGIGAYCTVTSSNVRAIKVGTRIFYAQAAGEDTLDSDVILYAGRRNTANGHCTLDIESGIGKCRLFGGTGTLEGIRARVDVSYLGGPNFAWDGKYWFSEDRDD